MRTTIKSEAVPGLTWEIIHHVEAGPTEQEADFIRRWSPAVYAFGDGGGFLWAFDEKMPSGRYLENQRFTNDLTRAAALVL